MADTPRIRAQLLALLADNATGQISAQDFRDFLVTVMAEEFVNPEDFWAYPLASKISTDKSGRGTILHSQTVGSDCSFMNCMFLNASNVWMRADASTSTLNGLLAIALNSYTSGASDADMLRKGILYHSAYSATWSGYIGKPIWLASGAPGSISITKTTNSTRLLGYLIGTSDGSTVTASGKWFFDPDWSVAGT